MNGSPAAGEPRETLAGTWCSEHWETLFGELGSYDFAREAFKAGWAAACGLPTPQDQAAVPPGA